MERTSSTVRRRAWINSSRQWPTLEELDPHGPPLTIPSACTADDDVFADGCFTGKIENWLQDCGSEGCSENAGHWSFESVLKANNTEDELSLGADASVLNGGETTSGAGTSLRRPCLPSLKSTASSCLSSSTRRTTSSVSNVLQLCSEDAEETLYELGFGCDEPQVTVRIPPRFFTFPSQARGINFRLFLDSQLRRIQEDDPSLSIASRFRQVQVLTAMANAFYSLYSHVSRTPVQKLATPVFTFTSSPVERLERFRSSIRSEPRSPVDRLKDTVSKMCLYTGSPRGSDSTSPQPSPRKRLSLPDVVDIVLDKVKIDVSKRLDFDRYNWGNPAVDDRRVTDVDASSNSGRTEPTHKPVEDTDGFQDEKISNKEMQNPKYKVYADENSIKLKELNSTLPHNSSETEGIHRPHIQHKTESSVSEPDGDSHPGSGASSGDARQVETSRSLPVLAPNGTYTRYCITVGDWEGDDSISFNTSDHTQASNQTCEDSSIEGKSRFLNPPTPRALGHNGQNRQQANSFELEEVHSAGEEDFGQSETSRILKSPPFSKEQNKGAVARGDSMQSDSSGYADEDVSPL